MIRHSLFLTLFLSTMLLAETEYNQWHINNVGVLSVITQTEKNEPVFVSIAAGGTPGANVVISLTQEASCNEKQTSALLWINNVQQKVGFHCEHIDDVCLISYVIDVTENANIIYFSLKSGFTVVLDKRIKIWAANINTPDSL